MPMDTDNVRHGVRRKYNPAAKTMPSGSAKANVTIGPDHFVGQKMPEEGGSGVGGFGGVHGQSEIGRLHGRFSAGNGVCTR